MHVEAGERVRGAIDALAQLGVGEPLPRVEDDCRMVRAVAGVAGQQRSEIHGSSVAGDDGGGRVDHEGSTD